MYAEKGVLRTWCWKNQYLISTWERKGFMRETPMNDKKNKKEHYAEKPSEKKTFK